MPRLTIHSGAGWRELIDRLKFFKYFPALLEKSGCLARAICPRGIRGIRLIKTIGDNLAWCLIGSWYMKWSGSIKRFLEGRLPRLQRGSVYKRAKFGVGSAGSHLFSESDVHSARRIGQTRRRPCSPRGVSRRFGGGFRCSGPETGMISILE